MMIGAGGLQVPAGGVFFNAGGNKESVRLMANQTWSGPTAETTRKRLGIGNAADTTFMTAADGVDALTVNGWLDLWLCSSANDLQNVTVCIEAPAVLKLPQQNDAHIRAKKLVLKGNDDPEWKLALVNGVLKLKKDSGLILLFQ